MNLRKVDNENVIRINDIVYKKGENNHYNVIVVFDYIEHDLFGLMARRVKLDLAQVKAIFQQLVRSVALLHTHNIIHRDIKSLLIRCKRAC